MDTQLINNHSFNIKLAIEVGIEKSLLLGRINYFVEHNSKVGKCFRDGYFWMYDTSSALAEVYPYMNENSIRRWMLDLEKEGWIRTGNYNSKAYDKTKWYTIGPRMIEWLSSESLVQNERRSEESLVQNEQGSDDLFSSDAENCSNSKVFPLSPTQEDKSLVQNEQGSGKSLVQNERSIVQNERSIVQNERPIPVITHYNSNVALTTTAAPAVSDDFYNSRDLEKTIDAAWRMVFNKNPNPFQRDGIIKNLIDDRFTPEELLTILKDAFKVLLTTEDKSKKDFGYLCGTIRKMKVKLHEDKLRKQKQELDQRKAFQAQQDYERTYGRQQEDPEPTGVNLGGLTGMFSMDEPVRPLEITPDPPKPKLTKGSAEYQQAQEEYLKALQEK